MAYAAFLMLYKSRYSRLVQAALNLFKTKARIILKKGGKT